MAVNEVNKINLNLHNIPERELNKKRTTYE